MLAAALDLLDVRRASRLEDGLFTRLVDAEFMECVYTLGISGLDGLDVTKADVRPSRESSGWVAPLGLASTRVVVGFEVRFVEKIALIPF